MRETSARVSHRSQLASQSIAFGVIRGLSVLTIAILAIIIGFILFKGLWRSNEVRSTTLPWSEAAPAGLVVVVNSAVDSSLRTIDLDTLHGMFTDEYINWSKISADDFDLLPVAFDETTPEGRAAGKLLFGATGSPAWGGLVKKAGGTGEALAIIRSTPGAIAILPKEALGGAPMAGLRALPLRRLSLAVNPTVDGLVDNRKVQELDDGAISRLMAGRVSNWKELGGPDLPVRVLSPPRGSELETVLRASGLATGDPGPGPAADLASYIAELESTPGAVAPLFSTDALADEIHALVRSGVDSGWNLSLDFLTEAPRLSGKVGGISSIIYNTFLMLLLTIAMAGPIGIAAAVFQIEYARQGALSRILRLGTETLAGIPSIIFGLFGFLYFVNGLHFGFGLLSGCLTLTLMILPMIVRTSEEALKSVPRALREGSLALGATKLQTILKVVIPAAAPGILTGIILGVGRAVGETAALLFTMGSDYKAANGLFSSARALSSHIYLLFVEGISFDKAFSTATVLMIVVLAFNITAKRVVSRMTRFAGK